MINSSFLTETVQKKIKTTTSLHRLKTCKFKLSPSEGMILSLTERLAQVTKESNTVSVF